MTPITKDRVFTRKLSDRTYKYKVLSETPIGSFWRVKIIDIDGRQTASGAHLLAEQTIRDAMGKTNV